MRCQQTGSHMSDTSTDDLVTYEVADGIAHLEAGQAQGDRSRRGGRFHQIARGGIAAGGKGQGQGKGQRHKAFHGQRPIRRELGLRSMARANCVTARAVSRNSRITCIASVLKSDRAP